MKLPFRYITGDSYVNCSIIKESGNFQLKLSMGKSVTTFQVCVCESNEKTDVEVHTKKLTYIYIYISCPSEAGKIIYV